MNLLLTFYNFTERESPSLYGNASSFKYKLNCDYNNRYIFNLNAKDITKYSTNKHKHNFQVYATETRYCDAKLTNINYSPIQRSKIISKISKKFEYSIPLLS